MQPLIFHGYNPDVADRVALIDVALSADRELYLIQIHRGPSRDKLRSAATLGPYSESELPFHFQEAVGELRSEGYWPGGVPALLAELESLDSRERGQAALRLGWRRVVEAVDRLLELLPDAVDDACPIIDALGMIGDTKAVPILRDYARRKLLSRRRSAVEALRRIGDKEGLDQAITAALERLPEPIRASWPENNDIADSFAGEDFFALEAAKQALTLDTLYEIATPNAAAFVRRIINEISFASPYLWRAVKSVLKRSMLRHDYETFGQIAHAVEIQGRITSGTAANVKSGYDGKMHQTSIFSRATQKYLRRKTWRYLVDLARYQPESYASAAAEILIHYGPDDLHDQELSRCYAAQQILLGNSKRFQLDSRRLVFRPKGRKSKKTDGGREESFPELWDDQPAAYLRLLSAGQIQQVHEFAAEAVRNRHPLLIRSATHPELLAMIGAPFEVTVELALPELDRRFDPESPDWSLLSQMLSNDRPSVRTIGQRWLRQTAHLWLADADRVVEFLSLPSPNLRALVVELTAAQLKSSSGLRKTLAERLLPLLAGAEKTPDGHAGFAMVAQEALGAELAELVSISELAGWLATGSNAVKVLAGELLKQRPDAVTELGLNRLAAMAQHEIAAVRRAAHSLIRSALPALRTDPSVLFIMVESDWPDTRSLAMELLREKIDLASLGVEGYLGLLDSNRADVQDLGKELVKRNIAQLPASELALRIAEHPHANMRRFVMELAVQFLPENRESLSQMKSFCRSALLDLWPSRQVKQLVIEFLSARAIEDREQAEEAVTILGDMVRLHGKADAEQALEALVRIKLAHPDLPSTVELLPGGVS